MHLNYLFSDFTYITYLVVTISLVVGTKENQKDNFCLTFEKKVTNVSRTVPQLETQTILSICDRNGTFLNCPKRVTKLTNKFVWSEVTVLEPVKKCCPGYKEANAKCLPICTNNCDINGVCVSPDKCECNDGYVADKNDEHKCDPICVGCEYGKCIAPNLCECSDGYQLKFGENKCIPICSTDCPNGKCVAPNNCTCNENYYFNETLQSCEPECENGCQFGVCIAPNECICNDGYRLKNGSFDECEPICELHCSNGECIAPNECKCYVGYHLANESWNECAPICEPQCSNGICIAPNECKCDDGYHFKNGSFSKCEPICKPNCKYGKCVAPDECECDENFEFEEESFSDCKPICEPLCENANCVAPNVCICNKGYEKFQNQNSSNICCLICDSSKSCTNSSCGSSSVCECFESVRLNPTDNYSTTPEELLTEAARDNSHQRQSTFNWWLLLVCFILSLIIAMLAYISIWWYRNRKISYYMGDEKNYAVEYSANIKGDDNIKAFR